MKEISFLIFVIIGFIFWLSTLRFRNDLVPKKDSLYKVICALEKEGRPGAKLSKYLLFCTLISFVAGMVVTTFY